ncbi:TyeA family type III secretion system gatekeeper subunit [Aeromonas dhakensis]|uniref:TyeA family type III secretion system gatekeeper subunit n=1 Tax=Aeromonas dhakensis TaxID=196024 RepID=UPI00111970E8|nr:TyeA family type III secretion system gatekeeper subunit [Aeromonas dhakensis]CAB5675953.1 type III secretion effector delivery regulator, TyeA family [Aeromonas hydrophila]MBL0675793.1 TyeA family type III secretion system gatekeeper subunit [Aeromonas dhakensis]MDX7743641.1 TyeA family type III secretion system gatekeeper subunit [Aeromonas dhakensis]TND57736.1 TyeA family type III secretion system gatekeeper subunit [Aeromonas dhakensis]WAF99341.1 TyeA family type III secretion system ga
MAYGPSDLMGDLIALVEKRWATVRDVEQVGAALELDEVQKQVLLYQELKRLVRLLPVELFSEEEQRQNLLQCCQGALDNAIEREEDELSGDPS